MATPARERGAMSPTDRRLLGDLLADMGPRLQAYVRHLIGHSQDVEDIVAESFCRAADNIGTLRKMQRADLYLLTIARNLCRDRIRQARPGPRPGVDQSPPIAAADPADELGAREDVVLLRAAVDALPPSLREVVVLRLSTGLTFEEIAALVGVPLGTALSRMHAAVQQLRIGLGVVHER